MPDASAVSRPRRFGTSALIRTPGGAFTPRATSAASASCGIHFGDTKLVISIVADPGGDQRVDEADLVRGRHLARLVLQAVARADLVDRDLGVAASRAPHPGTIVRGRAASSSTSDGVSSSRRVDHAVRVRSGPTRRSCRPGRPATRQPAALPAAIPATESSMTRHSCGVEAERRHRRVVAVRARACCAPRPRPRRSRRTRACSPISGSTWVTSTRELPVTSARGVPRVHCSTLARAGQHGDADARRTPRRASSRSARSARRGSTSAAGSALCEAARRSRPTSAR